MIKPTIEVARELSNNHTIIPISIELFSDIKTPIQVLKCLKSTGKQCFLLESVEGGEKWGRYSFLGFEPELTVTCKNSVVKVCGTSISETYYENPKFVIKKILSENNSPQFPFLPSFTGGFVGTISYDFSKYFEGKLNLCENSSVDFDDLNLMLFDKIIAFDHLRQKMIIIVNIKTDNIEKNYIDGVMKLKEIENMIKEEKNTQCFKSKLLSEFTPVFSKESYCKMVETVKKHIFEGDIFQAVIANRFEATFEGDLLSTYRVLRTINPSPYMVYLDFGSMQIAAASPETLVSLKSGKLATFPIAGTCRRGQTNEEDEALICELLKNEKELSEHNMLVDLSRNDLGKISKFGSVLVTDYKQIQKFSHVSHITSTVTSNIKENLDQLDVLGAMLPAGTLSGAPKLRAMEIINELESEKRGVYGGAMGYIDFSGNMDMCISIRMAVKINEKVIVAAGAGIVYDSIPENEFNECVMKASAMIEALKRSQEVE